MGEDYLPYLNHACRVYEYSLILLLQKENKKLAIAAAFHDLDIWAKGTMDYLNGSSELAIDHLKRYETSLLVDEMKFIIENHHKLNRIKGNMEAEAFRKADLVDLTGGFIKFNIPKSIIREIENKYPRLGFTKLVTKKVLKWAIRHPLKPFPMIRW